ncbi:MAG: hypothetical protein D6681_15595 [Calditrichaeota bacterium]|nr:MAG: hypothetical protein D6681_15595 [Calditrichota bacterium]
MMKLLKIGLISVMLMGATAQGQIFQTAEALNRGDFSVGFSPVFFSHRGAEDFSLYVHGALGVDRRLEVDAKLGVGDPATYFGMALKGQLTRTAPHVSISGGFHVFDDFGLDGTANLTFPVNPYVDLYTGLDMDMVFATETFTPFWLLIGTEIAYRRQVNLLLEVELGLNDEAANIITVGAKFYLP